MKLRIQTIARLLFVVAILSSAILSGCGEGTTARSGPIRIVTTTGMIEDAVRNIVGEKGDVVALMGPGVDPHLYKATQGDLTKLTSADLIFYNGLHLEGKMVDAFEKISRTRKVVAVSDGIEESRLRRPAEFKGNHDPHIWFDVKLWSSAVAKISEELIAFDSANAELYRANTVRYLAQLDSLDKWTREQIATIPVERRVLVTAHDAFGYFGRAYEIEVRGLQGISTVSEFGLADISNLVDMLVERKIKAVFIESSVPRRSIDAVVEGVRAKGHQIVIGGQLYSDAMGNKGTPDGTYIGMVRANVNKIVSALR
jgi:manganese/zinc/iron transport system substrate-binding protein